MKYVIESMHPRGCENLDRRFVCRDWPTLSEAQYFLRMSGAANEEIEDLANQLIDNKAVTSKNDVTFLWQ